MRPAGPARHDRPRRSPLQVRARLPQRGRTSRLRQLLNHTSGIQDLFDASGRGRRHPRPPEPGPGPPPRSWPGSASRTSRPAPATTTRTPTSSSSVMVDREGHRPVAGVARPVGVPDAAGPGPHVPADRGDGPGPEGARLHGARRQSRRQLGRDDDPVHGRGDGRRSRPAPTSPRARTWRAGRTPSTAATSSTRRPWPSMVDISPTAALQVKPRYARTGSASKRRTVAGQVAWGHRGHLDGFWSAMEYLPASHVTIVVLDERGSGRTRSAPRRRWRRSCSLRLRRPRQARARQPPSQRSNRRARRDRRALSVSDLGLAAPANYARRAVKQSLQ